jgi:hypothetical protein
VKKPPVSLPHDDDAMDQWILARITASAQLDFDVAFVATSSPVDPPGDTLSEELDPGSGDGSNPTTQDNHNHASFSPGETKSASNTPESPPDTVASEAFDWSGNIIPRTDGSVLRFNLVRSDSTLS